MPSSERSQERGSGAGVLGADGVASAGLGAGAAGLGAGAAGAAAAGLSAAGFGVLGVAGSGVLAVAGVAGSGVPNVAGPGAGVVGVVGVAGLDVASRHVGVAVGGGAVGGLAVGGPAGRRGAVDWFRIAVSNRLNASLVSPARASAAPATCSLNPAWDPPESLALRAARQIGHHWHSGGSSVGSVVVASSQTSV